MKVTAVGTDTTIGGGSKGRAQAPDPCRTAIDALVQVDRSMATVLRALADAPPTAGLPAARLVGLAAHQTGWDVAYLRRCIETLQAMPLTWAAFDDGRISWSQLRRIVGPARRLCIADRATLDHQLSGAIDQNDRAEPDRICELAEDMACRLDDRRTAEREQATADRSYIHFQPRLTGGTDFHGHGDDDQIATLTAALDAAADRPVADDEQPVDVDGKPIPAAWLRHTARGAQRMEGLRRISAAYLAGADGGPARPSVTVVTDLTTITQSENDPGCTRAASRLLWNLAGGRRPLSSAAVRMLTCDADHVPMLTDGPQLLAIGDAHNPITTSLRRAVIARDQGCRFPGCGAPSAHSDLHHVVHRADGGPTTPGNLVALCRPHHRTVHQHNWRLTLTDGVLTVRHGRWQFTSQPRLRPPPPTRAAAPRDSGQARGSPATGSVATHREPNPKMADQLPF
ncbi:HNH endonuclease signature motif containing protein [Euzebya tangerina]|uniref:HNH endonuclease signature motif containing protein n=1 Tax=Euzebya tangerina TaxID=591198 RepID=UPI000E31CBD9|nr:HNH endonuclease signature motif containing protein [Euzebya tangerina]